jgi:hypothetical protein
VVPRGINSYKMSGTVEDFEIITTSGEPAIGCHRIRGREGIRVCGSNVVAEDFYMEISGVGSDHADGVQGYAGGGQYNFKNIVLRRGNLIVGGSANAAVFFGDGSGVELVLEDMRIDGRGAPNGALFTANIPGDKGCTSLSLRNVQLIGGYRLREGISNGGCTILRWDNVTDGNGNPIPRP